MIIYHLISLWTAVALGYTFPEDNSSGSAIAWVTSSQESSCKVIPNLFADYSLLHILRDSSCRCLCHYRKGASCQGSRDSALPS